MTDSFDELSARFLAWFKQLPGATFSDAIAIQDLRSRNAGRGIVALQDIPPETILFTIPRNSIISLSTSDLHDKLPALLSSSSSSDNDNDTDTDTEKQPDPWVALILVLLRHHLRDPAAPSAWQPYLDVLPAAFATPMFWPPHDIDALLQASPAAARAHAGRAEADAMLRRVILPAVRAGAAHLFPGADGLSDEEVVALAHRMGSTIMAYAFDLDAEDDEDEEDEDGEGDGWVEDRDGGAMLGLVPMADLLNADAEFNAHVNHEDDRLVVTTLRHIRAGDEIINYYGPLPNAELLRRYGYVTPRHARYDLVELPWEMIETAAASHLHLPPDVVTRVRNKLDDHLQDTFIIDRPCPDITPQGLFPTTPTPPVVTALPTDLTQQLCDFLRALGAVHADLLPVDRSKEALVVDITLRALRALAARYPTTLEEDELRLRQLDGDADGDGRERMALVVRTGEKRLLREAVAYLEGKARRRRDGDADGGWGGSVKKMRMG